MKIIAQLLGKQQLLLRFSLLSIMLLCCSGALQAQSQKVTLSKLQTIKEAFESIERQTSLTIAYNESIIDINKKVPQNITDTPLSEALTVLLANSGADYRIQGEQILIVAKTADNNQKTTYRGNVVSSQGEALIGAQIVIKDTPIATMTDMDGDFSIVARRGDDILISYFGHLTQEVKLRERTTINITLWPDTKLLKEVVVVGYAPMRKSDFSGSVANIGAAELPTSLPSLGQALVGKVAGVTVTQPSGSPGSGVNIQIRGVSSLSAGSSPLYVIDGYPASEDVYINPDDVESIDILKDAASAAIYGSRGAGGVVFITTKRGAGGRAKVEYSYQFSIQQASKKLDLLNGEQFRDLVIEARNNSYQDLAEAAGKSWSPYDDNTTRVANGFPIGTVGIPALFFDFTTGKAVKPQHDTDWQDAIFRNAGMHRHNLSVDGGKDFLRYRFSVGYLDQDGIISPSSHRRVNVRANVDAKVTKRFGVGVNFSFDDISNRLVQSDGRYINDGVVQSALLMFPQFPVYNEDGSYAVGNQIAMKAEGFQMVENPVALAHEIDIRQVSSRMNFNAVATYDILSSLQAKLNVGTQYFNSRYNYYRPRTVGQDGDMPNSTGAAARVKAQDRTVRDVDRLGEFTLNFSEQYGVHRVEALLGGSMQRKSYDRVYATGINFPDDRIHEITAHGPNPGDVSIDGATRKAAWAMLSYFARLNYSYDNRYNVTGTIRRDGSSRFGAQNKWGWFYSVAGGWNVSNEKFFADIFGNKTTLRIRASWGLSGNNNIGNYEHTAVMSQGGYVFGNSVESAYWAGSFRDEAIGWEKTSQINLGFDLGLLNGRVNLMANYYNSESYDLLYDQPISAISGSTSVKTNLKDARVRNRGVDFQVDARILTGEFKWNVSANISVNRNKVLDLGGVNDLYLVSERSVVSHVTRSGLPIGSFYGYSTQGVISELDYDNIMIDKANLVNGKFPDGYELAGPAVPNYSSVRPGDVKWSDDNRDGYVNDDDRHILGDAYPDFTYGINMSFAYKGFDLSTTFTGQQGASVINFQKYYLYNMEGSGNQLTSVLDRWVSEENPGRYGVFRATRSATNNISMRLASYMVEDASYFRCSNITLGYNFKKSLLSRVKIDGLRLYVSVDNLFTISGYEGYNPEVDYKGSNLLPGFDWGVYPLARTFSVGARLTF